jgi:hypothetical protein
LPDMEASVAILSWALVSELTRLSCGLTNLNVRDPDYFSTASYADVGDCRAHLDLISRKYVGMKTLVDMEKLVDTKTFVGI